MSRLITFSFLLLTSSFLLADGTKLDNKYVNASYDYVDDPARPTIIQLIERKGVAGFDEMTSPSALAPYVASPEAADALLGEVKPGYATDAEAACRIAALSQYVMEGAGTPWWKFWATSRTAERRLWTEALLRAATAATDEYVVCYYLDQLHWCGFADQASRIRLLGVEKKLPHVREVCEIVARDLAGE